MGLFGGGSSRSGSAQKWATPLAKAAAGDVQGVYDANAAGLQNMTDQVQGLMPGLVNKFNSGNAGVQGANNYVSDVLSGKYMQGNPYLDSIVNQTAGDVTSRVGAAYGSRGSFGGTAWAQALSKGLADSENALRYGNYSDEMGRMGQAAAMAPATAAGEYVGLSPLLQTAGVGAALPYEGINALSGGLSSLFSGGVQKSGGLGASLLGGVASGVGSALGNKIKF